MLVLSRKINESVAFYLNGEKILTVTMVAANKDKIKVGFSAAPDLIIARSEISEEIVQEMIRNPKVKKESK